MTTSAFLEYSLLTGMVLMMLSILLGFLRLWRGPTLGDRVVALDMMSAAVIGFAALFALYSRAESALDIAALLALISFVPVAALARYAGRQKMRGQKDG